MSGRGLVLALLGAGGAYLLLRDLGGPGQQGQVVYVQQPAGAGGGDKVAVLGKFVEWIGGKVGGGGGGAGSPGQGVLIDRLPDLVAPQVAGAGRGLRPLLDLIGRAEAPRGYDQYFGGIRPEHAPPRPLTHLTVKQVLDWQDSIDRYYISEAAGRYQVMEDTLRGLVPGQVSPSALFNAATQDGIAEVLMERRGLSRYRAGRLSAEGFANNLAKEWAGLPVVSGPKKGRSYYDGDGINSATVSVSEVMAAVRGIV